MKQTRFTLKIGKKELTGIWAIVIGILLLIPIIALIGFVLSIVFSIAGFVLMIVLGIGLVAVVIGLISLALPKKWREKLGIYFKFKWTHTPKEEKPTTTPDGHPIIDVDYKED